jgi:hypothetical protein
MQRQHDNLRKLKPNAVSVSTTATTTTRNAGNEFQIKANDLPHYAAPHNNAIVNGSAFYQHPFRAHGSHGKKSSFKHGTLLDGNNNIDDDDDFRFVQMKTANAIVDSDRANQRYLTEMPQKQQHQHNFRMNGNRFSINQQENGRDDTGPTGVINHHHQRHHQCLPNQSDNTNHPLMNENDNHSPNEIDIRVKFENYHQKRNYINGPQGNGM